MLPNLLGSRVRAALQPTGLLRALAHRPFALLWSGQTISRLGDSVYRIALAWWVLEHTGSARAMGTVLIYSFTPMLLFLLIGGVAVDRLPRVALMLGSDILSGLTVAVVALLAATGQLVVWHVYLASLVFGFVEAFFQPAYQSLIPDLTPGEALPSANALTSLSAQVIGIMGPGIGAALVALGGTATAFALDAASFFIAAMCVLPLRNRKQPAAAAAKPRTSALADLRAGIATVLHTPWLWITIAVFALVNVTKGGPWSVTLPFLLRETRGLGVEALGWLTGATALGAVVGSVALGRMRALRRRGIVAYGAALVGGLTLLPFSLPVPFAVLMISAFLNGVGIAIFSLIWTTTLQEMVPRDRLGRVISIDLLGSFVLLPVGYGVAGWATDLLGPATVFMAGGVLTTLLIALGLAHPAVRNLD
jgi:MFS family permease